jgi:hypothetical protein
MTRGGATRRRRAVPWWRRALPWVLAWLGLQAVVAGAGLVAARRLDQGDEQSSRIRRVRTMGGFELHPTNPELASIRFDLGMGGATLDLTGLGRPGRPIDLSVHLLMGGVGVKVPPDWRVWWSFAGIGGMGGDGGVQRTRDEHAADLRIRARVLFGGVGVETAD